MSGYRWMYYQTGLPPAAQYLAQTGLMPQFTSWLQQQAPAGVPITPMGMPAMPKEQEVSMLEAQAKMLGDQLEQVKKRLEELRK